MLFSMAKKLKKYIFKGTCRRIWGSWSFHNDLGGYCYTSVHYYRNFEQLCYMFICVIFDNKKGFKNLACFLESWGALSPFDLVGIICILFQLVWRFLCLQNMSSVRVEVSKERPELCGMFTAVLTRDLRDGICYGNSLQGKIQASASQSENPRFVSVPEGIWLHDIDPKQ